MKTIRAAIATKERPIIFSGPMVRAILRGDKTQTRRTIKLNASGRVQLHGKQWHTDDPNVVLGCPYGAIGDRLWVRETWQYYDRNPDGCRHEWFEGPNVTPVGNEILLTYWRKRLVYRSDGEPDPVNPISWRAPIHMPHWASRILLEITDVRVQRVQEISEEDARAEGIPVRPYGPASDLAAIDQFALLWTKINGKRGFGWDANPWVWAIKVVEVRG